MIQVIAAAAGLREGATSLVDGPWDAFKQCGQRSGGLDPRSG
jgi:hypothetical protein